MRLITVNEQIVFYGVKDGAPPSDDEIQSMLKNSILGPHMDQLVKQGFMICKYSFDEVMERAKQLKFPPEMLQNRFLAFAQIALADAYAQMKAAGEVAIGEKFKTEGLWSSPQGDMGLLTVCYDDPPQ